MSKGKGLIGAHTSTAGGLHNALLEGQRIGATTIQFFTSNQKQWKGRVLTPDIIEAWQNTLKETGIKEVMSHDSYLINLGSPNEEGLTKSRQAFQEEVKRCVDLGVTYLNFHPGAALDCEANHCLDKIIESILQIEPLLENSETTLLLEATAGQGSAVGHRFEHLAYILQGVKNRVPLGVCIDTCHIFVAGYDIRTPEAWDKTLKEFDQVIGLSHLYAFHVNDSTKPLGSRVDRHANLGEGEIGWDSFKFLMTDPRTKSLPKYLETPDGVERWAKEIQQLKEFAE
jgi:deoxyribonuclease IV